MRIVVDTNVFVSAALKQSSVPALAIRLAIRHGTLLKSTATEQQLFDVLARPYFASLLAAATRSWIADVLARAQTVEINERIIACRDPTDDKFLELAVNGKADVIVSGDKDLLVLSPFRDLQIVSAAAFIRMLTE